MTELIEKVKRIRDGEGTYTNRIYRENPEGVTVEKVCYTCDVVQSMDNFGMGGGFRGAFNVCNDCRYVGALSSPEISRYNLNSIERALRNDPSLRFAPKYDTKGRRWLFFYEKAEFRELALAEGWKAVREAYDVNAFVYRLLREELFTPEEIAEITAKTVPDKVHMPHPYEDFTLTIEDKRFPPRERAIIWLRDDAGMLYKVRGSNLATYRAGDKVTFTAKRKNRRQINNEKYIFLWYLKNGSIEKEVATE